MLSLNIGRKMWYWSLIFFLQSGRTLNPFWLVLTRSTPLWTTGERLPSSVKSAVTSSPSSSGLKGLNLERRPNTTQPSRCTSPQFTSVSWWHANTTKTSMEQENNLGCNFIKRSGTTTLWCCPQGTSGRVPMGRTSTSCWSPEPRRTTRACTFVWGPTRWATASGAPI